ncbi:MAG: M28 family peptidase [bacterium]|nr:M28 family peptidase [bacterium]
MPWPFMMMISALLLMSAAAPPPKPGVPVPAFSGAKAFALLERQCAFGPRVPGTPGHAKCLEFMTAELKACGASVVPQRFQGFLAVSKRRADMTNLIASFRPELKTRLLFCAHWDCRAFADLDPDPANRKRPVPGANDGASGTAVLLQAAAVMKTSPPPVGVDLVFFDGEDGGLESDLSTWCLGSRHFAANPSKSAAPRYAVLLDMIGDRDLSLPVEVNSRRYASGIVDLVWGTARRLGLSAFSSADGYEVMDDHLELIQAGIPAVDVIDLDYPHWHTTQDTPDKCSPQSLQSVGTLVLHLIYEAKP